MNWWLEPEHTQNTVYDTTDVTQVHYAMPAVRIPHPAEVTGLGLLLLLQETIQSHSHASVLKNNSIPKVTATSDTHCCAQNE